MAMNFRHRRSEEPEINLIPFIDVLLVILIFLMLSTTYSKFTELKVNLPVADSERARDYPKEIIVGVASDGRYTVNRDAVAGRDLATLTAALAAAAAGQNDRVVIVSADASAAHQSVINVLDAARRAGLQQLTFATQGSRNGADAEPR
ncbi:Biopolymer transport protein ExbD [Methylibium sp. T29]|jgi:biopolymer transport protein ExbD|uniref:Putative biopolymer transport exbD-related transmembrane protein n=2 Tax=Sphaerotilaceae TaxID=2975441 RepID=A2SIQ0_METPP|nr:putative biopolymer transport exbD-related transmembrane protein [Methylibium petroleiphilum PM1]EWS52716.1 Biopolymer transport protein ExbD [Methylibium sp. T29]EWS57629.1 Biopolymer transport protein ExbD [Methylibium sp. T29-B]|eukprot:Opistho-2@60106